MDSANGWTKYFSAIGLLGLLMGIMYLNPLANAPQLEPLQHLYKRVTEFTFGTPTHDFAVEYLKQCPDHKFQSVRLVSRAPDIMLIEGFLTKDEANVLVSQA
jgi:hypothetical protein